MSTIKETVISNFSDAAVIDNFRVSSDGTLTKRDGCVSLGEFDGFVRGCCSVSADMLYVVAGSKLYILYCGEALCLGELPGAVFGDEETCIMYIYAGILYVIGGGGFYCYDEITSTLKSCEYIPIYLSDSEEYTKEELNNITSRVYEVVRFKTTSSTYTLSRAPTEIKIRRFDGVSVPSSHFTVTYNNGMGYVKLTNTSILASEEYFIIEYTINPSYFSPEKERYTACRNAYVYEGESGVRILLYNSEEGAMFYSEPNPNDPYIGTYYPRENVFFAPNAEKIRCITRFGEKTLVITDVSTYYLAEDTRTSGESIIFKGFRLVEMKKDLGISENSGVVSYEGVIYFMNSFGLYSLSYNPVEFKYTTKLMTIPDNVGVPRNDYSKARLHVDRVNREIWCQNGEVVAVYSFTNKKWYRFSGFKATKFFTYQDASAFTEANRICVFAVGEHLDHGTGFDAYVETRNLDLGNIFVEKTIFGFGAAFERCEGAKFECTLKSDKGSSFTFEVSADNHNSDTTPVVKRTHARLGNCYYVICRISSPPSLPPTKLRSVMISYKTMGGNA